MNENLRAQAGFWVVCLLYPQESSTPRFSQAERVPAETDLPASLQVPLAVQKNLERSCRKRLSQIPPASPTSQTQQARWLARGSGRPTHVVAALQPEKRSLQLVKS
mmetsp:Transcript_6848/g.12088  ORF Transcript_6848/g.12088 Transcript_6848/m.12088 type:complete len:106 (+) Transcript_6848:964-1281(+)